MHSSLVHSRTRLQTRHLVLLGGVRQARDVERSRFRHRSCQYRSRAMSSQLTDIATTSMSVSLTAQTLTREPAVESLECRSGGCLSHRQCPSPFYLRLSHLPARIVNAL